MLLGEIDFERQAQIRKTIDKAYQSLRESELLQRAGFVSGSLTRAYSAMFHGASAVLLSRDMDIIKPSAAVSFFDREIIKKGLIEQRYQGLFARAYDNYHIAEYDLDPIDGGAAESMANDARDFIGRMERYLRDNGWA